jgi:hypothetical protein
LTYDNAEYFSLYGLALAYTRRCSEAIPIFQTLMASVTGDSDAIPNSEAGIAVCESYAANPPTSTPLPPITEMPVQPSGTPSATATP